MHCTKIYLSSIPRSQNKMEMLKNMAAIKKMTKQQQRHPKCVVANHRASEGHYSLTPAPEEAGSSAEDST